MTTTLAAFLDSLFSEGRVRVAPPADIGPRELADADVVLMETERRYRRGLPGTPPPLAIESARWAAVVFFRACQFVVFRDLGEDQLDQALQPNCPDDDSPATHYSVDLTFQYLPDLLKLAQKPSEDDPLVKRLRDWADRWPLSSVGIADVSPIAVDAIVGHPSLLSLYVDRILARSDDSRLVDSRIRRRAMESVGAFPELVPSMAASRASDNVLRQS